MGFPIFGLFLVAQCLMSSPGSVYRWLTKEKFIWICNAVQKFSDQLIVWWSWWTRVFMLQATYCTGALLLPLYYASFIYVDADYKPLESKRNRFIKRKRNRKGYGILTMAGRSCVFSDVCNVYGKELAMLRQPVMYCQ